MSSRPNKQFSTLDQAAGWSGLSARSLRRLVSQGRLKAYRPLPSRVLIDLNELEKLIRSAPARRADGPLESQE